MQKIYVLLRNDQQTGPYSLEEISKIDLKPYDLIWIEGKSAGWYYPQEIGALHPYLPFISKKQPVSKPATAASKAFVVLPTAPKQETPITPPPVVPPTPLPQESYFSPRPATDNLEEKVYRQFSDVRQEPVTAGSTIEPQIKTSKKPITVGVLSVLVIGGVFAASWILNRTSDEAPPANETIETSPAGDELSSTATADVAAQPITTHLTDGQKRLKEKNGVRKTAAQSLPPLQEKKGQETAVNGSGDNPAIYEPVPSATKEESAADNEPVETPTETGAPTEKKKKLRDKIFDLFKKKPEEQKSEEASRDDNGERNSSRREAGANLAQMVHVRFTVPNDWMMGIKGAKATLVNRSTQVITKATVEVLYYDDDNQLLQKKTILFNRIDAKDSQTIGIPDHPSATKVDYNVLSAEGRPAA